MKNLFLAISLALIGSVNTAFATDLGCYSRGYSQVVDGRGYYGSTTSDGSQILFDARNHESQLGLQALYESEGKTTYCIFGDGSVESRGGRAIQVVVAVTKLEATPSKQ